MVRSSSQIQQKSTKEGEGIYTFQLEAEDIQAEHDLYLII
jgi:hypothetical protein